VSTSKKQASQKKCSLLIVTKGKHKYIVKYDPACKKELFDLLLSYGQDDAYNLTSFDALALIERMTAHGDGASVISLSEEKSELMRDLTFENLAREADEENMP